ncbi:unnamed protein product [Amoebophrya sp. A25]|nr:unnamed protein product [Amoebophrya sp. A25]|eukprot:GSA25T00015367001.1
MMSAISKRRDFLPLDEFKRIVRQLGFTRANELKAWCRSPTRPPSVPRCPHKVYRRQGWVTHLEALGRPRAEHQALTPGALKETLTGSGLTCRKYFKFEQADVAIAWVENLLEEEGYESKRLPRLAQGSLIVRRRVNAGPAKQVHHQGLGLLSCGEGEQDQEWRVLQVRCAYDKRPNAGTTVVLSRTRVCPDVGVLVVNPMHEKALALHVDSYHVRKCLRGRSYFWLSGLPSIRGSEGRANFLADVEKLLARLKPQSYAAWLMDRPAAAASVRRSKLQLQLMEQIINPSGLQHELPTRLLDAHDFTLAGRACLAHTCTLAPESARGLTISLRRVRTVHGRPLVIPMGNADDLDFVFALLGDKTAKLVGLFIFPRRYLIKWGVFAENFVGGKTCMTLYPPGARIRYASKRVQAAEQQKFYIDLTAEKTQRSGVGKNDADVSSVQSSVVERFSRLFLEN